MDLSTFDPLDPLAESPERRQLRDTVRTLVRDFSPHAHTQALDDAEQFDDALYEQLAAMGVLAIDAPEDVGGIGDLRDQLVVIEELAAGPTSMAAFLIVQFMIIQVLRGYASTPQQHVVLEQRRELAQILPAEAALLKHYDIHPKFITETENRIKFCLRLKQ